MIKYLLDLKVAASPIGIFISQRRYGFDIITKKLLRGQNHCLLQSSHHKLLNADGQLFVILSYDGNCCFVMLQQLFMLV